ncbi:methyltransferase domain-containing protein [Pseudomaricurvus sp. HS19]|uniref:methyltransferase domain-containing protein n=1 Tax=Pseudomaricurvus sp. HS19 TaxID=2692626 RepID=UPI001367B48F|nr:methyltransferase domain-containing protein [Pseudomaricurvus sp. HS19]MYM62073.1 methyltransferase domain-containing protein [Pseudomaricurvus sp. HS19]
MTQSKPPAIPPGVADSDRNFDDLAHRFKRNVYDTLKGRIRLEILERDLREFLPGLFTADARRLRILDAGGGQGQLGLSLAALGHELVICDLSAEMLKLAREKAAQLGLGERVTFHHGPVQEYVSEMSRKTQTFDLILCHAVLEWVVEPQQLLQILTAGLRAGGFLSLSYYNVNSIKMKNLLRTNFRKVIDDDYRGYRGSLTPTWPREPDEVDRWLAALPLERLCCSGIRCFHDYLLDPASRQNEPEQQLLLERRLSREEPWRQLARYIHVLSRKSLA